MKLHLPPGNATRSFREIHANRRIISMSYPWLTGIAVLSAIAGLGQAAILLIVVRVATALTAQTEQISGAVGPISASELSTPALLWIGVAILVGLFIVELLASACHAHLYARAQRTTQRHLLHAYSRAGFDAQNTTNRGDTQQLLHVHAGQAAGLVNAVGSGVTAAVNFGVLVLSALILSPFAALVVLAGLSIMLLLLRPLITRSRFLGDLRANEQRTMAALLSERLELNREIRTFGIEPFADAQVAEQIDAVASVFERLRLISRMTSVSYRLGAFALIIGMLAVIDASNSTSLAALTGALLMLLRSLSYGQATQAALQTASESTPVVHQLLLEAERFAASSPLQGTRQPDQPRLEHIELTGLSFAYQNASNGRTVLHGIDLSIDAGTFVAFVGPSGSGKSTLMSLLLGLREPTEGGVLVNGIPLPQVDPTWWRSRVAYVAQDPRLLSGSVIEAIRFGRPEVSIDDAKRAAVRAHIADEIEQWPAGWDTEVGQLGDQLSGGQRQRVAIARALAADPDLLLLDEPTSALDAHSEALISETLDELRGEMTIVAIAHRLQTIDTADCVHRIVDGRVVAPIDDAPLDLDKPPTGTALRESKQQVATLQE